MHSGPGPTAEGPANHFFAPARATCFSQSAFQQQRRFSNVLFGSSRQFIDTVQVIEPANSAGIRPVEPYQLNPGRYHPVCMTIHRRMNQYIPRRGVYAAAVTRFLEAARQNHRRIRAQVAMPRQAEAAGQGFDSRCDAAKVRVVDRRRHVQS